MKKLSVLAVLAVVMLSGCDKDDDPIVTNTTCPSAPVQSVNVSFNHLVGSSPMALNTTYTDDFGNAYEFTRAEFYLSELAVINDATDTNHFSNHHILVDPTVSSYYLGSANPGNFVSIFFGVGVDTLTNNTIQPVTAPAGSDLEVQFPDMYWTWASGYKYVVLEGNVDTTGNGSFDVTFAYHIGTNALYAPVSAVSELQTLASGGTITMALDLNWGAFLAGIDIPNNLGTHTMDNLPLAVTMAGNGAVAFN